MRNTANLLASSQMPRAGQHVRNVYEYDETKKKNLDSVARTGSTWENSNDAGMTPAEWETDMHKYQTNIIAICVDTRNRGEHVNGVRTLRYWEREHGKLPDTAVVVPDDADNPNRLMMFHTDNFAWPVDAYEECGIAVHCGPGEIDPNDCPLAEADDTVMEFIEFIHDVLEWCYSTPDVDIEMVG